jgi:hypothetical protein
MQILPTHLSYQKRIQTKGERPVQYHLLEYRKYFDYIKIGPYIKDRGPLNNPNTNQRMYKIDHEFYHNFVDITNKFWKHED